MSTRKMVILCKRQSLFVHCFTSYSRVLLSHDDVTFVGEGLQNVDPRLTPTAFTPGGIFIVPHFTVTRELGFLQSRLKDRQNSRFLRQDGVNQINSCTFINLSPFRENIAYHFIRSVNLIIFSKV